MGVSRLPQVASRGGLFPLAPKGAGTEPPSASPGAGPPPPAAATMHKHYTVRFARGALPLQTPAERYFLDPELGHQKGRGSVWGGPSRERDLGVGGC